MAGVLESFELLGYWWLPGERSVREIAGRFSFDPVDGCRLELHGSLDERVEIGRYFPDATPVIQGVTEDGRQWSLFNCRIVAVRNRHPGYPLTKFIVQVALKNVLYDNSTPKFDRVWVGVSHLPDWVGQSVWSTDWGAKDSPEHPGFRIEYVQPPEVAAEVPSLGATLRIAHSYSHGGGFGVTPHIDEDVSVEFTFEESREIDSILRWVVFPVQNFITLATETPNAVTSITVADSAIKAFDRDDAPPLLIEAYAAVAGRDVKTERVDSLFMLFDLSRLGDRFPEVVARWFEVSVKFEVVCQLLFGQEYSGDTVLDFAFLAYAQAAEAYHRLRFGGTDIPPDDHTLRFDAVANAAPEQYRGWLEGRLAYSNEPTLRNRLRELYDYVAPTMLSVAPRTNLVKALANHRNSLTHRDRPGEDDERDWQQVFDTMEATKIMLRACLITDLGFEPEEVAELFRESQVSARRAHGIRERFH